VSWTIRAGYASSALRDVARRTRPLDASPVALVGRGPVVSARLDLARSKRLHRFGVVFAPAGELSSVGPLHTVARGQDERLVTLGGSYEYRRYPLRDVLLKGLDIGVGGLATGDWRSLQRTFSAGIAIRETEALAGIGLVAAASYRPWRRFGVEAGWTNGGALARTTQRHAAGAVSSFSSLGGGWQTRLEVNGDLRIGRRTSLAVSYFRSDGGLFTSHHAVVSSASHVTVGVTYGK
jgi:hypothetical protein